MHLQQKLAARHGLILDIVCLLLVLLNIVICLSTATMNITTVNDTVIADPLFTVPIYVPDPADRALLGSDQNRPILCYEVHGRADKFYNLVTDECTSVNAHYIGISKHHNIIDEVSIRAVDNTSSACTNIRIDLAGCRTFVNDIPMSMYNMNGISMRRMFSNATGRGRVRVSVPNCKDLRLVMRINCQVQMLYNPNGTTFISRMLRYEVMRGLNSGHSDAHGLLGTIIHV